MGYKYDHSEIARATDRLQSTINDLRPAIESLNVATKTLSDEIGYSLQGAAYDKLKSYLKQFILPMTQAFSNILDDIETVKSDFNAKEQYVSKYGSPIDTDNLQNSVLGFTIASRGLRELVRLVPDSFSTDMEAKANTYDKLVREMSDKIEAVNKFAVETNGIFDSVDSVVNALISGLDSLSGVEIRHDGSIPFTGDTAWLGTLKKYNSAFNSGNSLTGTISRPKGMSNEDFKKYKAEIQANAKKLHNEGWSTAAIRDGYIKQVKNMYEKYDRVKDVDWAQNIFKEAHVVGSDTFTKMVDVAYPDTKKGARATLDMVYNVLGARIDKYNYMQLGNVANGRYSFPTDPNEVAEYVDGFVPKFCELEQKTFEKEELKGSLDNQMRYWLDKPVIDMINANGWTREQYHKWVEDNHIKHTDWGSSDAQAHNRILRALVPKKLSDAEKKDPKKVEEYEKEVEKSKLLRSALLPFIGRNYKDQIGGSKGYHLEVVFDSNGKTVSQWNPEVLKYNADGTVNSNPDSYKDNPEIFEIVANTDSANYAEEGGTQHDQLDYKPAAGNKGYECDFRTKSKEMYVQLPDSDWKKLSKKKGKSMWEEVLTEMKNS